MPNNQFGDFQTPIELARKCLQRLELDSLTRILEPTCGYGSFLQAASEVAPDSERVGIELQEHYLESASQHGRILNLNLFETDLLRDVEWSGPGPLVVVGNPPWVTSAELNRMDSDNLPKKENFKGAKGLDAVLGGSNFDVCEYIILKVLTELTDADVTLGMLCKTHVARNVIEHAWRSGLPMSSASLYKIDAMRWFGAGVDACWFVTSVDRNARQGEHIAQVFDSLDALTPTHRFGVVKNRWVSNADKYAATMSADGQSPYEWRSGLKHDAASVFELVAVPTPSTKAGDPVDVESEYLFPLIKCTDVFRGRHDELTKWVIVPQRKFGDETRHLRHTAPKLWSYLEKSGHLLDGRKSSIYKNRPRFSVFGHGDYTYAPYKVAVSGLHKQPVFRLVGPLDGKPVVLDDTCYFLPFEDGVEAALVWALLSSDQCQALIESLVFWDSKRPLTKKLLARLDIYALKVDRDTVIHEAVTAAKGLGVSVDDLSVTQLLDGRGRIKLKSDETLF
jgi:methylase of polypeptide subunit release factors